ncbi:protein S100-A12-like [Ornithorhynchus anatinus]|uniref:protein S100-A12-like n=1 Tax=Ornithorhynchus anatinus TaxID=9258 RepID=UPI0001556592|nr:protein S100-A12-like [Ornithorhynchus anatinus]
MSAAKVIQENTPAEKEMFVIIDVYHKYSEKGGDRDGLEKAEFEEMVIQEAPHFYKKVVKNRDALNKIYKEANVDGDKKLCFKEFVMVLSRISIEAHDRSHEVENPCQDTLPGRDRPGQTPTQGPTEEGHDHGHHH